MSTNELLRVISVRSQNPKGFGGCIFSAVPVTFNDKEKLKRKYVVVKARAAVIGDIQILPGQYWRVGGTPFERIIEHGNYKAVEFHIEASFAQLHHPVGEQVVTFLAENPTFGGIGLVRAKKLWRKFGESLYTLLNQADVSSLSSALTQSGAQRLIESWRLFVNSHSLQLLQSEGINVAVTRRVSIFFGEEALNKLNDDPYRLLSLCATWKQTDSLALRHFRVASIDIRRLLAAVEESCYRAFNAGHTALSFSTVIEHADRILQGGALDSPYRAKIHELLKERVSNGGFVFNPTQVQSLGAALMEKRIARSVTERIHDESRFIHLSHEDINSIVTQFENDEGTLLSEEQRRAIHVATTRRLALITGGAGVGKTTVLKALYKVYDKAKVKIIQLALAGRAAKRMQEVTGRHASTIAGFLYNCTEDDLSEPSVVIIDESSMVDIVTMSRLCEMLPSLVGILMVGDPNQLMPVGPGVVFHSLVRCADVPKAELNVVKRYGNEISHVAQAVLEGNLPLLSADENAPIAFFRCATDASSIDRNSLVETVLRLYSLSPSETQILSTRRGRQDGTKTINTYCQRAMADTSRPIRIWDFEVAQYVHTGLHVGDRILCIKNLWHRGLQNGALGTIVDTNEGTHTIGLEISHSNDERCGWVDWDDGIRRPITVDMLGDIELGYAITVHKAQGSQWRRVIIPVAPNRLLDRTLLYTAITRAREQVILVGDEVAAQHAVAQLPRVQRRTIGLDYMLQNQLEESESKKFS